MKKKHLSLLVLFAAKALLALQIYPFLSLCSTVSTVGIVHSFVLSCHISRSISRCFYSSIFENEMNDVGEVLTLPEEENFPKPKQIRKKKHAITHQPLWPHGNKKIHQPGEGK